MEWSDWVSLAAIVISAIALVVSIGADRRSAEKHEFDTESTWHSEYEIDRAREEIVLRFRCKGPRHIFRARIDIDPLLNSVAPLPIRYVSYGYSIPEGDSIYMSVEMEDNILDLIPDTVTVRWSYTLGKFRRTMVRLRYLFYPQGLSDEIHYHAVQMSETKRAIATELNTED